MRLAGVKRRGPRLLGWDELASKTSYFTGSNPNHWLTGIPNFSRVSRRSVYDGIDVTYHGIQGQLECEFKLAPHARPGIIALELLGARDLRKDERGDLVFAVANVEMRLRKPMAYQQVNGSIRNVTSHYVVTGNLVTLELGRYDSSKALVIDPVLSYSGYLKLEDTESLPASLLQSISPRSTSTELFPGEVGHKPSRHTNPMENF